MQEEQDLPTSRLFELLQGKYQSGELQRQLALLESPGSDAKVEGLKYIADLASTSRHSAEQDSANVKAYVQLCDVALVHVAPLLYSGSRDVYDAARDTFEKLGMEQTGDRDWTIRALEKPLGREIEKKVYVN